MVLRIAIWAPGSIRMSINCAICDHGQYRNYCMQQEGGQSRNMKRNKSYQSLKAGPLRPSVIRISVHVYSENAIGTCTSSDAYVFD